MRQWADVGVEGLGERSKDCRTAYISTSGKQGLLASLPSFLVMAPALVATTLVPRPSKSQQLVGKEILAKSSTSAVKVVGAYAWETVSATLSR